VPDFFLLDFNGDNPIRLSDYRGRKPEGLVFGSFTSPPSTPGTVRLHALYGKYPKLVQFLTIYMREAYPVDGWWLGKGFFGMMQKP